MGTFFSYYAMVFVAALAYAGWKVLKRTRVVRPAGADLVWDKPVIDAYEAALTAPPESSGTSCSGWSGGRSTSRAVRTRTLSRQRGRPARVDASETCVCSWLLTI